MYESIDYSVEDPVATITLNRPDRLNALTGPMLLELKHALAAAEADERAVAILLTGAGRGFCAGADMQMLKAITEGGRQDGTAADLDADPGDPAMGPDFEVGYAYLLSIRKPILAAINGPCAGLGFVIAMLSDMRFASEQATFTTAFANRGLIAEHGISWILPRLVGPSTALDLLWTGRKFDASEAHRLGVVNRVEPHDNLLDCSRAYLESLAATSSPTSLMIIKQQVYKHLMAGLGDGIRESNRLMEESLGREDFKEGVASFLEKRPPRFPRVTV